MDPKSCVNEAIGEKLGEENITCSIVNKGKPNSIVEDFECVLKANRASKIDQNVLSNVIPGINAESSESPNDASIMDFSDAMVVPISRSVKEYEEQMSALRKENFNLKLRLYFLEESVPGYHANTNEGPETVMKQLVDSKIEIASLRGEIQEKQDLLNDAVQVIKRMEKDRTSFEAKTQEIINELKKRIEFLEHDNNCNLEQFSKISNADIESVKNASRVLELEKLLNESEDKLADFQNQINKLDDILSHRDDTIRDYEEKIQNLVSTNAEQMEVIDEKEKRFSNLQNLLVNVNDLNAELKRDNENLVKTLKSANEHFSKEVMDIKTCEKQMQEQQDALRKMQSTISIKTANTAQLLERIQEYENVVAQMNFDRNLAKRENRFFRSIIDKLQKYNEDPIAVQKEKIFHHNYDTNEKSANKNTILDHYENIKLKNNYHNEYKLQQYAVSYSNKDHLNSKALDYKCSSNEIYMHECCDIKSDIMLEPHKLPIHYTISEENFCIPSQKESCSSLHANLSTSSIYHDNRKAFLKEQNLVNGVHYIYSKFGNFH